MFIDIWRLKYYNIVMETYDRDIARCEAFMDAVKRHGIDYLKRAWDFEVCPKEIAKKALEDAGYDFNKIWARNARLGHNPYTDRDQVSLTWLSPIILNRKDSLLS